ncbi:MAG: Smr/MutS family protein [Dehalococcoidia bacterium]|nr:Smr/MutS family protein [Dehalococcoidia bacterium]
MRRRSNPRANLSSGYGERRDDFPVSELDLHARTVEEAVPMVGEFLRDACSRGWRKVRIIHGKGTGTLRLEVDRYLSRSSLVARYYPADRFHGGSGATDVELQG